MLKPLALTAALCAALTACAPPTEPSQQLHLTTPPATVVQRLDYYEQKCLTKTVYNGVYLGYGVSTATATQWTSRRYQTPTGGTTISYAAGGMDYARISVEPEGTGSHVKVHTRAVDTNGFVKAVQGVIPGCA